MPKPQTAHGPLRSFGRIQSRPVKPRQEALLTSLIPRIAVPTTPFEPRSLMPEAREVWLEIGFGGGEHLAGQAARARDVLLIGAEPFVNGVASALRHVEENALKPGGRFRFATDWSNYADWTLERMVARPDLFRWLGEKADDWRVAPADHITTRYETKKLGDCAPVFLEFERL